jgi:hypothetical protein
MKRALIFLPFVLVLTLVFMLLQTDENPQSVQAVMDDPADLPPSDEVLLAVTEAGDDRHVRESVASQPSLPALESEPPAPLVTEEREKVVLNGAAVRVDGEGVEHAGDSGSFAIAARRGSNLDRLQVEVVGGRWSAEVYPDAQLHIFNLILDGKSLLLRTEDYNVPEGLFLTVEGVERHQVQLRVLSAADESDLVGIEIWPGPYSFPTAIRHPGPEPAGEVVLRGGSSPVIIPAPKKAWRSALQYFVRAPGFAWNTIAIDHSASGERVVRLQPESSLEIQLIGNADWLDPEVRLWPPEASKWEAYAYSKGKPDEEGRVLFTSLAPGTYKASVERGWADRRTSYGSATVTVEAGEQAALSIQVELPEQPVPVTVSGTLSIPAGWTRRDMKLVFAGESDTEKWLTDELEHQESSMKVLPKGAAGEARFAWSVELPLAGSYRVQVNPLSVRRLLEVPKGGLEGVEMVIPPPADVEVRVIDDANGEEIPVEALNWSMPRVEGIVATPIYVATVNSVTGRVSFRAPSGEVLITPKGYSLATVERPPSFEVAPGPNVIDLRVHRQIGVRFTFFDGEGENDLLGHPEELQHR